MKHFFYTGGPIIMGTITVILIVMIAWAIYHFLPVLTNKETDLAKALSRLKYIKTIGTFGMVSGILGQLIGLYQAFSFLEAHGDVSQSLIGGGLKVSLIPAIYGILIFLLSLLFWMVFDYHVVKKLEKE
jgi:biopolymer transport protein ExbB/TolQ